MKVFGIVLVAVILTGCGGATSSGGASTSDPRVAAIQKALDTKSPTEAIESGTVCDLDSGYYYYGLKKFANIPGVTVSPEFIGHQTYNSSGYLAKSPYRKEECRRVTWSASSGARTKPDSVFGTVPLGRYVVDKIGDDSQQMRTTFTAFRAHFEPTATGKAFMARYKYDTVTKKYADGQAVMHKDADGNWVAQL